jgi:hypothetical protein
MPSAKVRQIPARQNCLDLAIQSEPARAGSITLHNPPVSAMCMCSGHCKLYIRTRMVNCLAKKLRWQRTPEHRRIDSSQNGMKLESTCPQD